MRFETCSYLKVLIAPDKFKGTLTAKAAASALARGWNNVRPNDSIEILPITDGGDGFGETLGTLLRAKGITTRTVDASHRPCRATWWWEPKSKTAIIESAAAIGLAMLPPKLFHPFQLDTCGLGKLIQNAAAKGADSCLLGIGGSATNDGGFGLARALGWHFVDRAGHSIEKWTDLNKLHRILPPAKRRWFRELLVAVDVQNPFLGKQGATRVYGPQKGIRPAEFAQAERCLRRLVSAYETQFGINFANTAGAGAAGGLGFGLAAFLFGELVPGFELFAKRASLDLRLRNVDLVITGEGCIDRSTLMGKGVGEIAIRAKKMNITCLAAAGVIDVNANVFQTFDHVHSLLDITSKREAMSRSAYWLEQLAQKIAASLRGHCH